MCYPKPGPRCSCHAKERLIKATQSGDANAIKEAKQDYLKTPAGIKSLKAIGRHELAKKLQDERQKLIQRSKEHAQLMEHINYAMKEFEGHEFHGQTLKQLNYFTEKYGTPSVGRSRAVFDRGDGYVVKLPLNGEGFSANHREALTSQTEDPYTPVAECRKETDYSVHPDGMEVLVMEKVKPVRLNYSQMPDWVMSVDCGQVGYNRKGELVAYDL